MSDLSNATDIDLEIEIKKRKDIEKESNKVFCPLCKDEMFIANKDNYTDNSGCYYAPYANCDCGFSYKPKTSHSFYKGMTGWDMLKSRRDNAVEEITSKFSR